MANLKNCTKYNVTNLKKCTKYNMTSFMNFLLNDTDDSAISQLKVKFFCKHWSPILNFSPFFEILQILTLNLLGSIITLITLTLCISYYQAKTKSTEFTREQNNLKTISFLTHAKQHLTQHLKSTTDYQSKS